MRVPLALLVLVLSPAYGHDFWLTTDPCRPEPGRAVQITVAGGHYFPASSIAVQDRVLARSILVTGVTTSVLETVIEGKQRVGRVDALPAGSHLAEVVIQRPHTPAPDYWARAVVCVGTATGTLYVARNEGLEIALEGAAGDLSAGRSLGVRTLVSGRPVDARIQHLQDGGGVEWIATDSDAPVALVLRKPGRHLLIFTEGAQSCSVAFCVDSP